MSMRLSHLIYQTRTLPVMPNYLDADIQQEHHRVRDRSYKPRRTPNAAIIHVTTTKITFQLRRLLAIRKVRYIIHTQSTETRAMRRSQPHHEPRALIEGQQDLVIHTQLTARPRIRALVGSQAMQLCLLQGHYYRTTQDPLGRLNRTECMLKTRSPRKI